MNQWRSIGGTTALLGLVVLVVVVLAVVPPYDGLRIKGKAFSRGCNPDTFSTGATPLHLILCPTPIVGTVRFVHARTNHVEFGQVRSVDQSRSSRCILILLLWRVCRNGRRRRRFGRLLPGGGNGIMGFQSMILLVPAMGGIIMDKEGGIPSSIKAFGSSMKTLAGFIKQNVTRCQNHLVRPSLKIFNKNWPGFYSYIIEEHTETPQTRKDKTNTPQKRHATVSPATIERAHKDQECKGYQCARVDRPVSQPADYY